MNANFRGKGRPPPTICGVRKLESLGYRMVKKIAEIFNRLSKAYQRYRRQTTDGIAIAYSERNVVTFAKTLLEKIAKSRFVPPVGGLRGNVHGSSMARWKERGRLFISAN